MNILLLAPHTDDEIMAAGTLAKYHRQGAVIDIAAFSYPKELPILKKEFETSCRIIGANPILLNYKVRMFSERRQQILDDIIKIKLQRDYDLILCPCSTDTHQDHEVINRECFRAFKNTSILGYHSPHNCITKHYHTFVELSHVEIGVKQNAAAAYKSQQERAYFKDDYMTVLAHANGVFIGAKYAEVFENIRTIIR